MMRYQNGGLKNQLAPRNNNPKQNKWLLAVNVVLFVCSAIIGGFNLYYEEYTSAVAMLLVLLVSFSNAWMAWARLKGKRI